MHARADTAPEILPTWPDDIFAILQRFDALFESIRRRGKRSGRAGEGECGRRE